MAKYTQKGKNLGKRVKIRHEIGKGQKNSLKIKGKKLEILKLKNGKNEEEKGQKMKKNRGKMLLKN